MKHPMYDLALMVGARLKKLRQKAGLTQAQLSDTIEGMVSATQIARYEQGNQFPRLAVFNALAKALDTTPLDIASGGGWPANFHEGLPRPVRADEIASGIKRARGNRPISEAADKAGITVDHWRWYEQGVTQPPYNVLVKMAGALNVAPEDFIEGPEQQEPVPASDFLKTAAAQSHDLLIAALDRERGLIEERGNLLAEIARLQEELDRKGEA